MTNSSHDQSPELQVKAQHQSHPSHLQRTYLLHFEAPEQVLNSRLKPVRSSLISTELQKCLPITPPYLVSAVSEKRQPTLQTRLIQQPLKTPSIHLTTKLSKSPNKASRNRQSVPEASTRFSLLIFNLYLVSLRIQVIIPTHTGVALLLKR